MLSPYHRRNHQFEPENKRERKFYIATMSTYHADLSKSRSKVKPIFKKLTQSEKNSLDLDRPLEQQDGLGIYDYGSGTTARSSHDIAYNSQIAARRGFHARSTSGTSQFSTATTASGHRAGSFVHPFQQTPRPYTPPLAASYQNSIRESEHSTDSPALTEEEDQLRHTFRSTAANSMSGSTNPLLQQTLRIQTKLPPTSSRLALATSHTTHAFSPEIISPLDNMSPATPSLRSSIDKGFRIRSRSGEVDTRLRSETIQEARRKFQEKEKLKEEKAAKEEIRAMEKKQQKEARQIEKGHRQSSASETTTRSKRSKSDLTMREKGDDFFGRDYNTVNISTPPFITEEHEQPNRSHTAMSNTKKKTHSAWTKLMMWLRTRFIRLGKKKRNS
ncbi:hypothetical protein ACMFMG_002510 [Clarireedia jacksonii]